MGVWLPACICTSTILGLLCVTLCPYVMLIRIIHTWCIRLIGKQMTTGVILYAFHLYFFEVYVGGRVGWDRVWYGGVWYGRVGCGGVW